MLNCVSLSLSLRRCHSSSAADLGDRWAGRAHAILVAYLPAELLFHLPSPVLSEEDGEGDGSGGRARFLEALSDGQLLCIAYNAALRASTRPWGFVPDSSIHDVLAHAADTTADEKNRRSSSSSAFDGGSGGGGGAAAAQSATTKIGTTYRRFENLRTWAAANKLRYSLNFVRLDAKRVARSENGWMEMLEGAVVRWAEKVVEEKRVEVDEEGG
jgi:hypothetical protein